MREREREREEKIKLIYLLIKPRFSIISRISFHQYDMYKMKYEIGRKWKISYEHLAYGKLATSIFRPLNLLMFHFTNIVRCV